MIRVKLTALVTTLVVTTASFALDVEAMSGPTHAEGVEQLSWLTGAWIGEGLGGEIEEYWTPPKGGTMHAAFRLVTGGETRIIEYLLITETPEGEMPPFFGHLAC